jgi:hypothetical protein
MTPEEQRDSWAKEIVLSAGVGVATTGDAGIRASIGFKF